MAVGSAQSWSQVGDIERAVSAIVSWYSRNDVQQETMSTARCPLPPGSVWLLARMAQSEPVRLSDLAQALSVDKSTLTPQAQRLEREGLVARGPDPSDRRAALLRLTRVGRAVLARLHVTRRAIFAERLADWSDRDLAQAATMLSRLAECLERRGTGEISATTS